MQCEAGSFGQLLLVAPSLILAQTTYQVVPVTDGGAINGQVTWSGPAPRGLDLPVNKDAGVCDPDGKKYKSLDRLVLGPNHGVANTIVFLRDISSGKPMSMPEPRRALDQRNAAMNRTPGTDLRYRTSCGDPQHQGAVCG